VNKDFDNNILDFTKRKKVLKVILLLLVISLAILLIQLFFKDNLSFAQGNLTIINSFIAFISLFLYITLTADMYVTIKRIKEREKIEVPVKNKNIKIFYKNQVIGTFEIEDISFVAFSGSGGQKVKKGDYPIMAVYSLRGEEFLRMPLLLRNYWLMKKYFLKYNVDIEDAYNL